VTSHRKGRGASWVVYVISALLVAGVTYLVGDTIRQAPAAAVTAPAAAPVTAAGDAPPAASAAPTPPPVRRGLAQAAVDAAQAKSGRSTQLAVAVLDRTTGELAVGSRGHEPYYTASLAKLIVIVDVLDRRRSEGLKVTDGDLALFRRALALSDDSAMNALWERFDGAAAVTRVSKRLGLEATRAPRVVGQWGQVEVTAADYVKLWHYVLDQMPAADRDLLVTDMRAAEPIAKDGFDQAFGLLSPAVRGDGSGAVAKQGWMCCFSGQYYLHSAGAAGADKRFVMAFLTRQPRGNGVPAIRSELTGIVTDAVGALE
jgi:beta-lactamase family protein